MSDAIEAAGSAPAPALPVEPAATSQPPLSVSEAASLLSRSRLAPKEPAPQAEAPAAQAAEPADTDPAAQAEDAAPHDEDPGQTEPTQDDPEGENLPPIEPPRSWTKEEKAEFAELPRSMQEKITAREAARETDFRRRQNAATEASKAAEAELAKAQQQRAQYEQALPALLQTLQSQNQAEFSDITSWEAAQRLAAEDPFRYAQWDLHQKRLQAVQTEMAQTQARAQQEAVQRFEQYAAEQDAKFAAMAPEFNDPKQADRVQAQAVQYLKDIGFEDAEIGDSWTGKRPLPLRDARMQALVRDAMRWRNAEARRAEVSAKPVPPVQRPGTPMSRGERVAADTQALERKLDQTGSIKDAWALRQARARSRG